MVVGIILPAILAVILLGIMLACRAYWLRRIVLALFVVALIFLIIVLVKNYGLLSCAKL